MMNYLVSIVVISLAHTCTCSCGILLALVQHSDDVMYTMYTCT